MTNIIRNKYLHKVKRIIVKVGSSILTNASGELNEKIFDEISTEISDIRSKGIEVVVVSSGAIAAGMKKLDIKEKPDDIVMKQALAACGQSTLMGLYEKSFQKHGVHTAQVLLTHAGFSDRKRFITARKTIFKLLKIGLLPIINENDVVANEEIMVGDNDNLAAMVTSLVEGDLLMLLTNIDGFYDGDPKKNVNARLLDFIEEVDVNILQYAGKTYGKTTTGGMITKLEAVKKAAAFGVPTIIANGLDPHNIFKIFSGENVGTFFMPSRDKLTGRKHWIAYTLKPAGKIRIDDGAKNAILNMRKSLLPSGILSVEGKFGIGDLVVCMDTENKEVARGLVSYDSEDIQKIIGVNTSKLVKILGYKYGDEVINRDDLVLV